MPAPKSHPLTKQQGKRIWLRAQRLDTVAPFGDGPRATKAAVEHLGYVQIDTINVIERCHHHILYTRIPAYQRADLRQAQSIDKTVFEYWTHALSYVPTQDMKFFIRDMRSYEPSQFYNAVTPKALRRILRLIRKEGPISIRDIEEEAVEKDHAWASRKPSKRVLQLGFYTGALTVSARSGMVKTYELMDRHFGWAKRPKAAPDKEITAYVLDRALRSQGVVSLDSACHLDAPHKKAVRKLIDARVRRKELVPVGLDGAGKTEHWARSETLDTLPDQSQQLVHLLSPFDPVVIQRKRLQLFFDYEHRFEAYVPKEKRKFGYFALPVLVGNEIVAAIDLKTDRQKGKLLIQKWTWLGRGSQKAGNKAHKKAIEAELDRFERFQLET
jgi:uncharacterized protein YcaQ